MDKNTTNSTINELLKVLDEQKFLKVINVSSVDNYIKKLTSYKFLQLFIIGQLNEIESLRALSKHLKDNENFQKTIDMDMISTAQLSRKQCDLSPALFEKVFRHLVLRYKQR
ncbi:DUF4372 domain-containing protein [Virgibacillus sp. W0181]|uniref:DUF4372 domain-containing protein n=1 Tax=Virgibacillus sp. W0181 TaxID=3391581 RepID=UPI003F476585